MQVDNSKSGDHLEKSPDHRGDHIEEAPDHQKAVVANVPERQAVTGHNVRYVLLVGLASIVILFAIYLFLFLR